MFMSHGYPVLYINWRMGTYVTSGEISFFIAALTSAIFWIDFSFYTHAEKQNSSSNLKI